MDLDGPGGDADRLAQVVSTALIIAALAFLVAPNFGYEALEPRLLATAVATVAFAVPVAVYMVYLRDGDESHFFGPWGPADLVFMIVVVPLLVGTTWLADASGLEGVLYWLFVLVGIVVAVSVGAVVRALTLGEWPPGGDGRRAHDDGPDSL